MTDVSASTAARPSPEIVGAGLAALTVLCWATFNVAAIHGLRAGLQPIDLTLLRFGTAGLVLAPVLVWMRRRDGGGRRWPSLHRTLCLAVLGGPLFGTLAVGGYAYAPLSHGMVVAPASVFLVGTVLAVTLNGEHVRTASLIGGGVVIAGLVVLAGPSTGDVAPGAWRGGVLFAAAGTLWAGFTVLMRRWCIDPIRGTLAVGTTAGLIAPAAFAVAALMGASTGLASASVPQIAIQALFQGLVGGVVSVFALMSAARLLGSAKAALLPSFAPIVALALAIPILGDWPSGFELIGVAIAAIGLAIASLRR
ncbi:MAG: DMT family transporter [Pseudomonadota bacterium]